MISFRDITEKNFYKILGMKLPSGAYCAQNVYSLAEAWLYKNAKPYGIYKDEDLVGFIMFDDSYEERELGIWRLMIAPEFQNKGLGSEVLQKILNDPEIREKYDYVYLFCVPENEHAMHVYEKAGFYKTGIIEDDEMLMRYDFKKQA